MSTPAPMYTHTSHTHQWCVSTYHSYTTVMYSNNQFSQKARDTDIDVGIRAAAAIFTEHSYTIGV